MMTITEDMKVCDVLDINENLTDIFMTHNLNCAGCPGANMETLKEAAAGHGADLDKLIADLNKALNSEV